MQRLSPRASLIGLVLAGVVMAAMLFVFVFTIGGHGTPSAQAIVPTTTPTVGPTPTPKSVNNGAGALSGLFDACAAIGVAPPPAPCTLDAPPVGPPATAYDCFIRTDESSVAGTTIGGAGTFAIKSALLCASVIPIGLGAGEPPCNAQHGNISGQGTPPNQGTPAPVVPGEGNCPGGHPGGGSPPYTGISPYKLQGFLCPASIVAGCPNPEGGLNIPPDGTWVIGCLPDFGTSLGPNAVIISTSTMAVASNPVIGGSAPNSARAYFHATNAQCTTAQNGALPGGLGTALPLATTLTRRDTSRVWCATAGHCPITTSASDPCTDFIRLWQNKIAGKCPWDPSNPFAPEGTPLDVSGTWDLTAELLRADWSGTAYIPGFYYNCTADIQQGAKSGTTSPLTGKILCLIDSPAVTVNPEVAAGSPVTGINNCAIPPALPDNITTVDPKYCGDGQAGAPPPGCNSTSPGTSACAVQAEQGCSTADGSCLTSSPPGTGGCPNPLPCDVSQYQFADIGTKHTMLTGVLNQTTNNMELTGCFSDDPENLGQLGNVYVKAKINAHTGAGAAVTYIGETLANCNAGTPAGGGVYVQISSVRQAPGPKAGASTTFPYGCIPNAGPGYSNCRSSAGDGCPDKMKLSDNPTQGGLRDPLNRWDYFNPEKANTPHSQTAADIFKVVLAFGKNQGNPAYSIDNDRTGLIGGNPWNLGPPDGQESAADILAIVKQFGHNC